MKVSVLNLPVLALIGLASSFPVMADSPDCAVEGGQLLSWPAAEPVWEMCWLGPNDSAGPRGSGLELRAVHHNGILVARKIHAPMLFAEYEGSTCYRDWKDQSSPTLAHTTTHNQLGTPPDLDRLASTSCSVSQHPTHSYGICPQGQATGSGYECSSGQNVIIEDLGDHVRFVSQYRADWYMYDSRISFFDNGAIEPIFGFGNHNGTNSGITHWHHNYWRFDFDIDGAPGNVVAIDDVDQAVEFSDVRGTPADAVTWSVRNEATGRGYRLVPGADDFNVATDESGRGFHTIDFMASRYHANEYGDNPSYNLMDCGMNEAGIVDGESIDNEDVVLWYRVAVRDSAANSWPPGCGSAGNPCIPQDSMICKSAGPRIVPFGPWGNEVDEADLGIALTLAPDPVAWGEPLALSIALDNAGPQQIAQADLTITLPAGLSFNSSSAGGSTTWTCSAAVDGAACALTAGVIAAEASAELEILLDVAPDAGSGDVTILAEVESGEWTDPDPANNAASIEVGIFDPADIIFADGFESGSK